jgi:nicotinate-nucleotide--dimethylbenzimidazole phosphoribosyltransferase
MRPRGTPSAPPGAGPAELAALCGRIVRPDPALAEVARARLDRLTKPPGSLGRLEALVTRVVVIAGHPRPRLTDPVVFTLAADHGVAAEGVSAYPQAVTREMVANFARGGAAVNALARAVGARVVVADLGVAGPPADLPGVRAWRIAPGTRSLARGPAMSRAQAVAAILAGARLVEEEGGDLAATGEMGIGSTTAASALTAALTGAGPEAVTGPGTGVDEATWRRKVAVVHRALAVNRPDARDPLGVLAALGGLEIAGLAGVVLAAAARRVPVVLDGFIATAAALAAVRLHPPAGEYLIAAHRSAEPGHAALLAALGLQPYLDLGLRLGEGSGALLGVGLVRAALACYDQMATFEEADVSGPGP